MVFSSLLFLFRFLPIVLLIYYAAPGCMKNMWKNLVLFFFSLVFYAWGEPVYVVLMLFSTLVDYINGGLTGYFVNRGQKGIARIFLIFSVIVNLSMLGVFKYSGFICDIWNDVTGMSLKAAELALPIGISFYTFQTMSYTIDVYRGDAKVEKNIISFGAYVALFPQLIAGPIVRFQDVARQLQKRTISVEKINYGVMRFVTGLGKKVLLANNAGLVWTTVSEYSADEMTMAAAWLGLLFYMFQIYFDFSGYSDMAIGLMSMLGFDILENFHYPYTSRSITEFWRRWHISLGTWFREYVYIPLGGNRKGRGRTFFNIFAVWFLTGLWHGASVNFICWGMYFWVFLMIEKNGLLKWLEKLPKFVGHAYAIIVVYFGWLLFAWEDIKGHRVFVKAMAGIGEAGIVDTQTAYLFVTNLVLLVLLILGSTQLPKKAVEKLFGKQLIETAFMDTEENSEDIGAKAPVTAKSEEQKAAVRMPEETIQKESKTDKAEGLLGNSGFAQGVFVCAQICFILGVFLVSTAYLVNATYNPFLYFRF